MSPLLPRTACAAVLLALAGCTFTTPRSASALPADGSAVPPGSGAGYVGLGGRPDAGPGSASDTREPRRDGVGAPASR